MNKPTEHLAPTPRTDAIYDTPRGDRTWPDVVKTHRDLAKELERLLATERAAREAAKDQLEQIITSRGQWMSKCETAEARLAEAIKLLEVAACPNCDGSGAKMVGERRLVSRDMAHDAGDPSLEGSVYSEPEVEQCQWCDERKQLPTTPPPILEEVRLLKVQISVADKAYNSLHERHQIAEASLKKVFCPWCQTTYEKGEDPYAAVLEHLKTCLAHPIARAEKAEAQLQIAREALESISKRTRLVDGQTYHPTADAELAQSALAQITEKK